MLFLFVTGELNWEINWKHNIRHKFKIKTHQVRWKKKIYHTKRFLTKRKLHPFFTIITKQIYVSTYKIPSSTTCCTILAHLPDHIICRTGQGFCACTCHTSKYSTCHHSYSLVRLQTTTITPRIIILVATRANE